MPLDSPWWLVGLLVGVAGSWLVRRAFERASERARQATRQILDQARQAGTKT